MMTIHATTTLTTSGTAYKIVSTAGDTTIQNNNSTANVFIGAEGVTTSNYGFKIVPGAAIAFELNGRDPIWAVSDTAGATVNTMIVQLEGTYIV
jgi:hypothetical protein